MGAEGCKGRAGPLRNADFGLRNGGLTQRRGPRGETVATRHKTHRGSAPLVPPHGSGRSGAGFGCGRRPPLAVWGETGRTEEREENEGVGSSHVAAEEGFTQWRRARGEAGFVRYFVDPLVRYSGGRGDADTRGGKDARTQRRADTDTRGCGDPGAACGALSVRGPLRGAFTTPATTKAARPRPGRAVSCIVQSRSGMGKMPVPRLPTCVSWARCPCHGLGPEPRNPTKPKGTQLCVRRPIAGPRGTCTLGTVGAADGKAASPSAAGALSPEP
jgi:hypothetical protein